MNSPFWVEVANPEHPFTAMLTSHSRGTCLIDVKYSERNLYNFNIQDFALNWVPGLVVHDGDLLVLVLPAKVPDVVEALEAVGRVGEPRLHDLVGDPRDLRRVFKMSVSLESYM